MNITPEPAVTYTITLSRYDLESLWLLSYTAEAGNLFPNEGRLHEKLAPYLGVVDDGWSASNLEEKLIQAGRRAPWGTR